MRSIRVLLLVPVIILSGCFGGGDKEEKKTAMNEPMANDFATVIAAHHQSIADDILAFSDDLYGIEKSSGESQANVSVTTDGLDVSATFVGTSDADISDLDEPKSYSNLDVDIAVKGGTPIFPTEVDLVVDTGLELIAYGQILYLKLNDPSLSLKDNEDVVAQIMTMVQLFSGQWLEFDPSEVAQGDDFSEGVGNNFPKLLEELAAMLPTKPIFALVEDQPQDGEYYVYTVTLDAENIADIFAHLARVADPTMEQEEIDEIREEMESDFDPEDFAGLLSIHSKNPGDWKFSAEDEEEGARIDVYQNDEGFGLGAMDDEGMKFNLDALKNGDMTKGTAALLLGGVETFDSEFSYEFGDESGEMSVLIRVLDAPGLTKPLIIDITSDYTRKEDGSIEIQKPEESVSLSDLAGFDAPVSVSIDGPVE